MNTNIKSRFLTPAESRTELFCESVIQIYLILTAASFGLHRLFTYGALTSVTQLIYHAFSILVLCVTLLRVKRIPIGYITVIAALACAVMLSWLVPENVIYLKDIFLTPSTYNTDFIMPLVFLVGDEPQKRTNQMLRAAFIGLPINILTVILGYMAKSEYMQFGYGCSLWCCVMIQAAFTAENSYNRIVCSVFAAIYSVLVVYYGNRAVILIFAAMAAVCFFRYTTLLKRITLANLACLAAVISVSVIELVMDMLIVKNGVGTENTIYSSRLMKIIRSGEITDFSSRSDLFNMMLPKIKASPIFGSGICADRVQAQHYLGLSPGAAVGRYAHNFILELCLNFGVIFGFAISAYIIFCGLRVICDRKRTQWSMLMAPTFVNGVILLSFSTSLYMIDCIWTIFMIYFVYRKSVNTKTSVCPDTQPSPQ